MPSTVFSASFRLRRGHHIATMSFYVYAIGTAGLFVVALFTGLPKVTSSGAWAMLFTLGIVQTIGALWAYTAGLRYMEAGVASILATFEPVVATLLAYFVVHERIEWAQMVGGAFIIAAVLLLQAGAFAGRRATDLAKSEPEIYAQ